MLAKDTWLMANPCLLQQSNDYCRSTFGVISPKKAATKYSVKEFLESAMEVRAAKSRFIAIEANQQRSWETTKVYNECVTFSICMHGLRYCLCENFLALPYRVANWPCWMNYIFIQIEEHRLPTLDAISDMKQAAAMLANWRRGGYRSAQGMWPDCLVI